MVHIKKIVLITLLFLTCSDIYSLEKVSNIMKCIAQEESRAHKVKFSRPYFNLNQDIFNEWAPEVPVDLKDQYFQKICLNSKKHPSMELMKYFLLHGKKIFKIISSDSSQYSLTISAFDRLTKLMPHIFFRFISSLQSYAPYAGCLESKVPHLKKLKEQYHALEENISVEQIFKNKKHLQVVFKHLENPQKIFNKCKNSKKK